MLRWNSIRGIAKLSQRVYATANIPVGNIKINENIQDVDDKKKSQTAVPSSNTSKLVAAAFESLKTINRKSKSSADEMLDTATEVNTLLSIAEQPVIAKQHALKVVNKLASWVQAGKCELKDFEIDARFVKLCRILGSMSSNTAFKDELSDLSIVLGVAVDAEAIKLIEGINLSQMVKILSSLKTQKRRPLNLLRSLSNSMAKSSEQLNIKEAADVFYACASLNIKDDVLLEKTTSDTLLCLKDNKKSSIVRSIVKSIGIISYRHTALLDSICTWFIMNKSLCSPKELLSMLYTLASVNYFPATFDEFMTTLEPFLNRKSMTSDDEWISVVWSLVVLNRYDEKVIDSVLNPNFLQKLNMGAENENIAVRLKLLNINGYAKQQDKYKGNLLDEKSPIFEVPLLRCKEHQLFFDSVIETLGNVVELQAYVRKDIDSKMGFLIDAEVLLNDKRDFVNLSNTTGENVSKVAIMICTYHDMCMGSRNQLTGKKALIHKLIKNSGYKLLCVPYNEFNPQDKLFARIQYLNRTFKMLD